MSLGLLQIGRGDLKFMTGNFLQTEGGEFERHQHLPDRGSVMKEVSELHYGKCNVQSL